MSGLSPFFKREPFYPPHRVKTLARYLIGLSVALTSTYVFTQTLYGLFNNKGLKYKPCPDTAPALNRYCERVSPLNPFEQPWLGFYLVMGIMYLSLLWVAAQQLISHPPFPNADDEAGRVFLLADSELSLKRIRPNLYYISRFLILCYCTALIVQMVRLGFNQQDTLSACENTDQPGILTCHSGGQDYPYNAYHIANAILSLPGLMLNIYGVFKIPSFIADVRDTFCARKFACCFQSAQTRMRAPGMEMAGAAVRTNFNRNDPPHRTAEAAFA